MINLIKSFLKKISALIIFVNFITITTAAFSETYWSNVKDGPYNVEQAKKKFEGRRLDFIEGIWFSDGLGSLVVFKKNDNHKNENTKDRLL